MKIFLINLDKDKERLSAFEAQAHSMGITYERVSGVYTKELTKKQKKSYVDRFRCWCAYGQMLNDGEIGCEASHQSIYRKIINEKIPLACILEDDVVLDERFLEVLARIEENYDYTRPQVVLLSNHSEPEGQEGDGYSGYLTPKSVNDVSLIRIKADFFTEGYVIGIEAARALLYQNSPMMVPADHWGRWVKNGAIELYHACPTVCSQNKSGFDSSTQPTGTKRVRDRSVFYWIFRKSYRLVGVAIDKFLTAITGR